MSDETLLQRTASSKQQFKECPRILPETPKDWEIEEKRTLFQNHAIDTFQSSELVKKVTAKKPRGRKSRDKRRTRHTKNYPRTEQTKESAVTARIRISKFTTVYHSSIKISSLKQQPEIVEIELPENQIPVQIHLFGKTVETRISYRTTTKELIEILWEAIERRIKANKYEISIVLETPFSQKQLRPEDSPVTEILKWKLNHALLALDNKQLVPQKNLLSQTGFLLRVVKAPSSKAKLERKQEKQKKPPLQKTMPPQQKQIEHTSYTFLYNLFFREILAPIKIFLITVVLWGWSIIRSLVSEELLAEYQRIKRPKEPIKLTQRPSRHRWKGFLIDLNLSNLGLTEVPPPLFKLSNLHHLDISNNQITVLPKRLNHLNLYSIDASNNKISHIEKPLTIPVINLQNNNISEYTSRPEQKRVNILDNPLEEIKLSARQLQVRDIFIYKKIDGSLNQLKEISMVDVNIKRFIGKYPVLESMILINNNLHEISIRADNLESVFCSHNHLTEFPFIDQRKYQSEFPRLKYLSLPYNALNIIPDRVWKLSIEYLNLSYNQIVRIDIPIRQTSLLHLNVSGNQIKEVYNLGRIVNLICFIASFNMLESIPGLNNLMHLRIVNLSYNMLKVLPRMPRRQKGVAGNSSFIVTEDISDALLPLPEGNPIVSEISSPEIPQTNTLSSLQPLTGTDIFREVSDSDLEEDQGQSATPCLLYVIGNSDLHIPEYIKIDLLRKGIVIANKDYYNLFITLPGTLTRKNCCIYCQTQVPENRKEKDKYKTEKQAHKIAKTHSKKLLISSCSANTQIPMTIDLYYSTRSKRISSVLEMALLKLQRYIESATGKTIEERWNTYKDKIHQVFIEILCDIFPEPIAILCMIISTGKYFCIGGIGPVEVLLLRNEELVYLKSGTDFELVWAEKDPTDECIILLSRLLLQKINTNDLIAAYKRHNGISGIREYLALHEIETTTALVIPLIHRADILLRKETEMTAPKVIESLSVYNMSSSFMKVPVVVFTDIVNSTKLWSMDTIQMREVSKMHNNTIRDLMRRLEGYEVKTEGDAFMMIFYDEQSAMEFGAEIHKTLLSKNWLEIALINNPLLYHKRTPIFKGLQIRVGMSKGACVIENDPITKRLDFYGKSVIEAARLCSIAGAGETLISQTLYNWVKEIKNPKYILIPRGRVLLSGLETETHHIYEVLHKKLLRRLLIRSILAKKHSPWLTVK
ncbi:hypothetical protein NEOKW01_1153 [Nematocida sp. AWRm80]|nr:hypothetical protein NEOKW01_1153 [Nematocida sp. AWRm80]